MTKNTNPTKNCRFVCASSFLVCRSNAQIFITSRISISFRAIFYQTFIKRRRASPRNTGELFFPAVIRPRQDNRLIDRRPAFYLPENVRFGSGCGRGTRPTASRS